MKLTIIILIFSLMQVSAATFGQNITLKENRISLERVFEEVRKQTGYDVFLSAKQVKLSTTVNVDFSNTPLKVALDKVLDGLPVTYTIDQKIVVVKEVEKSLLDRLSDYLTSIDVSGRIVDKENRPLAGANVRVKGTSIVTSTNDNGEFLLKNVDEKAVLEITLLGYRPLEAKAEKSLGNIALEQVSAELSEVTVSTGYQKISKERFVGSFAQLDSANFHRRDGMNIIDRLDGTVPGVLFNRKATGGSATGTGFPLQIRGISTLGQVGTSPSTYPLIVVDNFPMDDRFDINSINPNDVESVTVLKDAAAASIWGTRAGNGVIVITTKKGRFNKPLQINITSNVSVDDKPDLFSYGRVSPSDFIDIEKFLFSKNFYDAALNNTTKPVVSSVVDILEKQRSGALSSSAASAQIDALRSYDVRDELRKYVYRNAVRQQHSVSFNGGSSTVNYQLSTGFNQSLNNIQGSLPDNQFTLASNTTIRPVKNLEIQTNISLAQTYNGSYSFAADPASYMPYSRLADDKGNPLALVKTYRKAYLDTLKQGRLLDWNFRPLDEIRLADSRTKGLFAKLNLNLGYKILPWLSANVAYQYTRNNSATRNNQNPNAYAVRELINKYTNFAQTSTLLRYPVPIGGILDLSNTQSQAQNARASLNFNKTIATVHSLTALVVAEISDTRGYFNSQGFYGYSDANGGYNTSIDFLTSYPTIINGTLAPVPARSTYSEQPYNRTVSLLGNVAYTYNQKYSLYGSARRDGSNVFGVNTNNRWKPLWSVGGSWDVSKEQFYKVDWIPQIKLRASYGYTGNVNNLLSGVFTTLTASNTDRFTGLKFASPQNAPNSDLRWEQVENTNLGLDFSLFKSRIGGSFDFFLKKSTDLISLLPFDQTSGVTTYTVNAASLRGKGFDLTLNSINLKGKLGWTTNLGLSRSKTIVTKFYRTSGGFQAQDYINGNSSLNATEGQIAFGLSSYRWAGLDPQTGDPQGYLNGQVSKNYSGIFQDAVQNQVFNGSSMPLTSGFIRNNFNYKSFSFSFNITGRFNYYFREPVLNLAYAATMTGTNYMATYYQRWQKPGDEEFTNIPSMPYPVPSNVSSRATFYQNSEITVKKADNIRLQDVRLSWMLVNTNRRLPFKNTQFYIYPNSLNIILWRAQQSDYDPDFSSPTTAATSAPISRIWTFGLSVGI